MKKVLVIFSCVFVFSCTSNTIFEKPKDLIPKDTMVLLIQDLYIASSATNIKNKYQERKVNYMPLVYKKYKIDSLRFQKSNSYYTTIIDDYEEIYTQVKEALEKKRNIFKEQNNLLDSLRRDSISKRVKKPKKLKEDLLQRPKI